MFEALRQQLVESLDPVEMERLIACAASAVTGLPLRHAKSGVQYGADAAAEGLKIEVKAYLNSSPPDVNLLGKLLQAAIDGANRPDVWVLAMTLPCSSQTFDAMQAAGKQLGVRVVVLDWQPGPLPALFALLAAGRAATLPWISQHCPGLSETVRAAMERVGGDGQDPAMVLKSLKSSLTPGLASYVATRRAMAESYYRAFGERSRAMVLFGQALTPLAAPGCIDRVGVFERLDEHLRSGLGGDPPLVLLGEEGVGKTWVIASYWLRRAPDALFVLIPSRLALRHAKNDARILLDSALRSALQQADERAPQWSLDFWRYGSDPNRRALIVLDGLNEQPSLAWPALIRDVRALIAQIGGRLVLTCRPRYWDRELAGRFAGESYPSVSVEGFSNEEFDEMLRRSGRDPERFSPALLGDLSNPRIFTLASRLSHSLDLVGGGPVTRERLLWRYWLHRREEKDDIVLSDESFRELLIGHAHSAWAEIKGDSRRAWRLRGKELPLTRDALELARGESIEQLTADLLDVADGKFFRLVTDGLRVRHAVAPDKLWYALGLRLAYEAHEAAETMQSSEDTREMVARILEPILEMDVAADILLAAFAVSVLHPQMSRSVARFFLVELAELRNRREDSGMSPAGENVVTYIAEAPEVYLAAANDLLGTPALCDEWIVDALRRGLELEGKTRQMIEHAVRAWLTDLKAAAGVEVALRILAGTPCEGFLEPIRAVLYSKDESLAELAIWFHALDEATRWPGRFTEHLEGEFAVLPDYDDEDSNPFLKEILAKASDFDVGSAKFVEDLARKPWNVALAPSLSACLPVWVIRTVRNSWDPQERVEEVMSALDYLLESELARLPVQERLGFLADMHVTVGPKTTSGGRAFLPSLSEDGMDRHLHRVITQTGYPARELDSPGLEAVSSALRLSLGAPEVTLGRESQALLLNIINDSSLPLDFRASAVAVAERCRDGWIAERLAERDWSAAVGGSVSSLGMLFASTVGAPGLYPRIREHIGLLQADRVLKIIHDQDFGLAVTDVDRMVRAACASICDDDTLKAIVEPRPKSLGERRPFGVPLFNREALQRLARNRPEVLVGWAREIESILDRLGYLGHLEHFAYSLLPAYAGVDPDRAARFLGRLLDVFTQSVWHQDAQQSIEYQWFYEAFAMPINAAIDAQLERMIRTCADDETLSIAVDAACVSGRMRWLEGFAERELSTGRVGRVARARYVLALAGLAARPIAGKGSLFWDSVEFQARRVEQARNDFLGAFDSWKSARTERDRLREEIAMFDAITGYFIRIEPPAGCGEPGELLCARLAQAVFDARTRLSRRLFGLAVPPGWITFGNVPPRCRRAVDGLQ